MSTGCSFNPEKVEKANYKSVQVGQSQGEFVLFQSEYQGLEPVLLVVIAGWHMTSNRCQHVIRITTRTEKNSTIVTIDGHVAESDLKEIQRVRKAIEGGVVMNLSGLDACAAGGVRVLRSWLDAGAQLQAATPFMRMMLEKTPT